ncbi:MAG: WD40/YVTN/BNR-like repeat-containing protein [Halobacteriaceae archaeon]
MHYLALRNELLVVETGSPDAATRTGAVPATVQARHRGHDFECVAAHPDAPERAFAGTFEDGLRRTTTAGDDWERVGGSTIASDAVLSVTVDPHDPATVYAGTEPSAVYRSRDGGETWAALDGLTELPSASRWSFPPRPHTHHVRWISVAPADPDRLYVGVEAGAFPRSTDGGETWLDHAEGARRDVHAIATHPDAPDRVYVAGGDGYAESDDDGETWRHPQTGLDHRYVWSVAVDPADPDRVVVSAARGARSAHSRPGEAYVYRREAGASWARCSGLPTGEGVLRPVLAAGRDAGAVCAASNRGLFRSADAGETWARVDVPWPDRFVAQAPRGLAVA